MKQPIKALTALRLYLEEMEAEIKQAKKGGKLKDLVAVYKVLYNGNESIKTFTSELNKIQEHMRYTALPEAMEDADETSITFGELQVRMACVPWVRASLEDKDKAHAWLKKHNLGAIIKPTVNASTLSALAKSRIEEGKELPPTIFKVTTGDYVSMTKLKEKPNNVNKKESSSKTK